MEFTEEGQGSNQMKKLPSGFNGLLFKTSPKQRASQSLFAPRKNKSSRRINAADYEKASIQYARRLADACLVEDNFPSLNVLGVLSIFDKLLTNVKPQVQEAAATGLIRLAKQSSAWAFSISEGGMLRTASACYVDAKPHVRTILLALFAEAGRHSQEMACAVVAAGGAKLAVTALMHPDDARVAAAAARLAGSLASAGRAPGRALLDCGVLPLLAAHLRDTSPQVQLQCARALAALSCWTPRVAAAMEAAALRPLVVRAATCGCGCRTRVPGAQWRAMAALAALAEQGPRCAERVAAAGGVPLVAAAVALLGSEKRTMARWAGGALLEALTRASAPLCELVTNCGALLPLVSEGCVLPEGGKERNRAPASLPGAQALLNIVSKSERAAAELIRACAVPRLTAAAMWTHPLPYCFTPAAEELWNTMEELSATAALILGEIAKHSPEHACVVLNQAGTSLLHLSSPVGDTEPDEFGEKPEQPKWCCPDGSVPQHPGNSLEMHAPRRAAAQQALCRCIGQSLDLTLLTALMSASSALVRHAARAQVLLLADESPVVRRICERSQSPTLATLRRATGLMTMPVDSVILLREGSLAKRSKDSGKVGWPPYQYFDDEEFDPMVPEEGDLKEIFQPSVLQYYETARTRRSWHARKIGKWTCQCKPFFTDASTDS